jgi:purine nucleoside phosphorylase
MGASSFGMSLVPEAVAAYAEGLEVFGCSMITNIAAGIDDSSLHLTHEDVIGVSGEFAPQFTKFMLAFISNVQTRPPRPLVIPPLDPAAARLQILPPVQATRATRAQMQEAVSFLQKQVAATFDLPAHSPEVAIYVSYGMEKIADYLLAQRAISNLVRVPYSKIPSFPCISRTARHGELCFALTTSEQTRSVVFLSGNSLESFNCEEGVFVAELLYDLGVQKLVHTFFAGSTSPLVRADTVRILADATDFTTIAPVASVPNQPQ